MTRTPPPPPTDKAKAALAKYRDSVSAAKRRDIEKAINHLRKTDATINVSTVARRAKVTRKTVLKHDDLMAIIDQYRYRPPTPGKAGTGNRPRHQHRGRTTPQGRHPSHRNQQAQNHCGTTPEHHRTTLRTTRRPAVR